MTLSSETSAMGNIDPFVLKKVNREYLFKLPYMNHRKKLFMTMDKNEVSAIYVSYTLIHCLKLFVILKT